MLVHADRVQEVASAHRVEVLAALEVEIVGAGVGGGAVLHRAALLRAQGDLQCLDDAARDVVLNREYVLAPAVVRLRPPVRIAGGLDQLPRYTPPVRAHPPAAHPGPGPP